MACHGSCCDGLSCMHESEHSEITFHEIADGAARNSICGRVMLIIADSIHTNTALSLSAVSARLFDESHVMALSHINGNLTSLGLPTKFTPSGPCQRDSVLSFAFSRFEVGASTRGDHICFCCLLSSSVGHKLVLCFPPQRQGIRKNRSGRFFKSLNIL